MFRLLAAILALFALASPSVARAPQRAPVVILISIDGFRPDYLDRGVTPHLNALAARGVSAAVRPAFPSKTFPNHWTLVTGVVPDRHGIVSNRFEDPTKPGDVFTITSDDPFWWNAAEPIWVTAEKAGVRTATMFWPGANVAWGGRKPSGGAPSEGGTRPQDWAQYNTAITPTQRVNTIIDWLRRPAAIRPRFLTLYFEQVDTAGHSFGPDDPRTTSTVAEIDRAIGDLLEGLKGIGQAADFVVVSDHGMAGISSERSIALDKVADPSLYRIVETGPFAGLVPTPGNEDKLAALLTAPHEHMQCWKRGDIPERFHYRTNPRIAPMFCLAEVGWYILPAASPVPFAGGNHGYDNQAPDMAALFIASGPHVAPRGKLAAFDNVDVAPLLRDLLGLPAGSGLDGNDAPFRGVLRK